MPSANATTETTPTATQPSAAERALAHEPPNTAESANAPVELTAELERGDAALDADQLEQARHHYERAASLAPNHPAAEIGLVRVRFAALGLPTAYAEAPGHAELERLVQTADAVLARHANYPPALLEKGRLLLVLGKADAALKSLAAAAALDKDNAEARSALGVAYLATGAAEKALPEFEAAAALEPTEPERLTNLGTAYMLRGRVSAAITSYQRALAIRPDDARTHADLGAAYLTDSRIDQAVQHLERANALSPGRATFLTNLGYAYQRQGQLGKAIETQRRALAIDPKLGSAWINLGNALAESRNYQEAETALRRAAALDPSDPRPKASLADLAELRAREGRSPQR